MSVLVARFQNQAVQPAAAPEFGPVLERDLSRPVAAGIVLYRKGFGADR